MSDKNTSTNTRARIGFVLLSSAEDPIPSTRIAALNIIPNLAAAGYEPVILYGPRVPKVQPDLSPQTDSILDAECDAVVFQKVHGPSVERIVEALTERGIVTMYCVCDQVDEEMTRKTDATITVTDFLRDLYPSYLREKVHVVHDGIERPDEYRLQRSSHRGSVTRPLNAVLVTSKRLEELPALAHIPPWLRVTIVGRYPPSTQLCSRLRHDRWTLQQASDSKRQIAFLRFLLHPRVRRVQWTSEGVYSAMKQADIGIIPIDRYGAEDQERLPPDWMLKSENRLTMKMAAALPVVATPIPSYETLIRNGKNGFLANSDSDWQDALEALRNPSLRLEIGRQARSDVIERFSIDSQATSFMAVLESLGLRPGRAYSDNRIPSADGET